MMNKYMKIIAGLLMLSVVMILSCTAKGELYEGDNGSGSVITISAQPTIITNVTVGNITGILTVSASVTQGATLSYQWYNNNTNSNKGGLAITGATNASFSIPASLAVGTYYYFCEVSATGGATPVRSTVATVNVAEASGTLPALTTNSVTTFAATIATLGGNITNVGTPAYTERGVVYATAQDPTTTNNKTVVTGTGMGIFTTDVTNLTANTMYYVRAYATNTMGTAYGQQVSFTTTNKNNNSGNWIQKANFPGIGRYFAVGFSIGNKGYIGTGCNGSENFQDFWEYDPISNTWTQKADFAGGVRRNAVGFSIGNKGYIGTGYNSDDTYLNDFWEYDPVSNSWTKKANFQAGIFVGNNFVGIGRSMAVGFSIRNKGYIGTGYGVFGFDQDFWEYDPDSNNWIQKTDFAGGARQAAVGFSIGNKGYIGTGYNGSGECQDFWEYDPISNSWTRKADFAGGVRSYAVGFSIGNKGYIGTGNDSGDYRDIWEYDIVSNAWIEKVNYAGGKRGYISYAVGFSIDNKGYVGTGVGYDGGTTIIFQDFWEFTP